MSVPVLVLVVAVVVVVVGGGGGGGVLGDRGWDEWMNNDG